MKLASTAELFIFNFVEVFLLLYFVVLMTIFAKFVTLSARM